MSTNKSLIKKHAYKKEKGLYIHVPFCASLCSYCDFSKMQYLNKFIDPYLDALKFEIESYNIKDIKTIYIGGGTPTCLAENELDKLLNLIDPYIENVIEYTVEGNIETITENKLKILKKHGVNRLSFGVESTNDELLKLMNRHHTFMEVKRIISLAKSYGFENISVDLILGFKERTLDDLKNEINDLLSLNVDHISTYCLTLHPHTKLYIDQYEPKDDDGMADEMDLVYKMLTENGYENYEVSNFAKPNKRSQHNLLYWHNNEYYGLGLGASGYLNNERYTNTRNIYKYIDHEFKAEKEFLTDEDEFKYYVLLNLRTIDGINEAQCKEIFDLDVSQTFKNSIAKWSKSGHLKEENGRLSLTYFGRMIMHTIVSDMFLEYELCI